MEPVAAVVGGLVGLCVGSFVGTLARRVPEDWRGVVAGRSACPSCGTRLGIVDLVPLLSWLLLRRRCRHCGAPISPYYPLVELTAAGIGATAAVVGDPWLAVLGWWLLALGLIDLRTGLLPDVLTLPLAALGLALQPQLDNLIGAIAGYAVFWIVASAYTRVRRREGLGMGDAKLLAAAGAWLGWEALPSVVLGAASVTLVVALAARRDLDATSRVPFGPGLAAALWLIAAIGLPPR